jgi:hypothetical protein
VTSRTPRPYINALFNPKGDSLDFGRGATIIRGRYIDRLDRRNGERRIAVREFVPHYSAQAQSLHDLPAPHARLLGTQADDAAVHVVVALDGEFVNVYGVNDTQEEVTGELVAGFLCTDGPAVQEVSPSTSGADGSHRARQRYLRERDVRLGCLR